MKESTYDRDLLMDHFRKLQKDIHGIAVEKGFWEKGKDGRNKGEAIALMHSELSECLEAIRKPTPEVSKAIPPFTNEVEELADLIIRALDYAEGFDLDLAGAVITKALFNAGREYKHGKEF